jgi:hypothetical protein
MVTKPHKQLTLDQAYQAAYLWLDHIGDPPIEISEPAHGSVELITDKTFVRVRSSDAPVEQSSVLALLRAAETGKRLVIFSPSGFSPGALSIAETQGIALYTLDPLGSALPETTHARAMAPSEAPDPPFAPSEPSPEDDFWSGATRPTADDRDPDDQGSEDEDPGIQAATTDWADCPNCGATHYRNAKFCRDCGTNLHTRDQGPAPAADASVPTTPPTPSAASAPPSSSRGTTGSRLRCRTCGSHDIELID